MSDSPQRPESREPPEPGATPWESDPPADDRGARHNAFTDARKGLFLGALAKSGCILDACRALGISSRTVYRHQESDPVFAENIRTALAMSAAPMELAAYRRAVEGVEQPFACGGEVHVRRHYSDGLLRLLLQGSNPRKYGPNPGFRRKRLLKHERKQMEREIRAELSISLRPRSLDEVKRSIVTKLDSIERHRQTEKLAAGWTKSADGHWVPPGYAWVGPPESGGASGTGAPGDDTPCGSV